jgi:hypothetical protein
MRLSTVLAFSTLAISIVSLCYDVHVYRNITMPPHLEAPSYISMTPEMMHDRVVVVHHYHN